MDTANAQYWEYERGMYMSDYKEMYKQLFRAVTRAIYFLQEAQKLTEDIDGDDVLIWLSLKDDSEKSEGDDKSGAG